MNNDIIPPNRPQQPNPGPQQSQSPTGTPSPSSHPLPDFLLEIGEGSPSGDTPPARKRRWLLYVLCGVAALLVTVIAIGLVWYTNALKPVSDSSEHVVVTIEPGATPDGIASHLEEKGLIRSKLAFLLYTRQQGVQGKLQAGSYRLAPNTSVKEIVEQLLAGKAAVFTITFYPGATLYDPSETDDSKRTDVYTMLRRAGFSDTEVREGLGKHYDHPLFAGKPAATSLEGYVYGETYQFENGTTVEQILTHTFDVFYERITQQGILEKLQDVDMTLYEAITLASIIEREVSGQIEDQRIVSQIFHRRLAVGEPLGADATFMYAAKQANTEPSITFNSPYNTRTHKGLPPGPISSPSIVALEAAVSPADTDYLFFVSGDDGRNHFAHTNAEHEENTRLYCTKLCSGIAP